MSNLDRDLAEMQRLGYGTNYGKYKLDHPDVGQEAPKPAGAKIRQCAPPKIYQLTCDLCGKAFTAKISYKKYCSDSCYKKASQQHYRARKAGTRVKPVGTCVICGTTFTQLRSTQKFCSEECKIVGNRENQRQWRARLKEAKQCDSITR